MNANTSVLLVEDLLLNTLKLSPVTLPTISSVLDGSAPITNYVSADGSILATHGIAYDRWRQIQFRELSEGHPVLTNITTRDGIHRVRNYLVAELGKLGMSYEESSSPKLNELHKLFNDIMDFQVASAAVGPVLIESSLVLERIEDMTNWDAVVRVAIRRAGDGPLCYIEARYTNVVAGHTRLIEEKQVQTAQEAVRMFFAALPPGHAIFCLSDAASLPKLFVDAAIQRPKMTAEELYGIFCKVVMTANKAFPTMRVNPVTPARYGVLSKTQQGSLASALSIAHAYVGMFIAANQADLKQQYAE